MVRREVWIWKGMSLGLMKRVAVVVKSEGLALWMRVSEVLCGEVSFREGVVVP